MNSQLKIEVHTAFCHPAIVSLKERLDYRIKETALDIKRSKQVTAALEMKLAEMVTQRKAYND